MVESRKVKVINSNDYLKIITPVILIQEQPVYIF